MYQPHRGIDEVADLIAHRSNTAVGNDIGRLNDHSLAVHVAGQFHLHNANTGKLHNGVVRVIARPDNLAENGDDPWLSFDLLQFVLHSGADTRVAVEVQLAVLIEFQAAPMILQILGAKAFALCAPMWIW